MKTLLKHITLLIFGGVIIPLYQPVSTLKPVQLNHPSPVKNLSANSSSPNAFHFYFMHDVVAKLLPVANLFK